MELALVPRRTPKETHWSTLEKTSLRRNEILRTLIMEDFEKSFGDPAERHLASEWLGRDCRVEENIARNDPFIPPSSVYVIQQSMRAS